MIKFYLSFIRLGSLIICPDQDVTASPSKTTPLYSTTTSSAFLASIALDFLPFSTSAFTITLAVAFCSLSSFACSFCVFLVAVFSQRTFFLILITALSSSFSLSFASLSSCFCRSLCSLSSLSCFFFCTCTAFIACFFSTSSCAALVSSSYWSLAAQNS